MHILASALLLLAPLAVLATPVAVPEPVALAAAAPTPVEALEARSPEEIFKRSPQSCAIITNDGTVNCRSGPGTGYAVTHTVNNGDRYTFQCYKSGTCYNGN